MAFATFYCLLMARVCARRAVAGRCARAVRAPLCGGRAPRVALARGSRSLQVLLELADYHLTKEEDVLFRTMVDEVRGGRGGGGGGGGRFCVLSVESGAACARLRRCAWHRLDFGTLS